MVGAPHPPSGRPARTAGGWVAAGALVVALSLSGTSVDAAVPDLAPEAATQDVPAEPWTPTLRLVPAPVPGPATTTESVPRRDRPRPSTADEPSPGPAIPVIDATKGSRSAARGARPVALAVPGSDIDVPVVPVGVTTDRSMELPDTVRKAGWYRFGATPSSTVGTTVIAAHVDTRKEGLGPFARLSSVRDGDQITVRDARGRSTEYQVTTRRQIRRTALPVDKLFTRDGRPRLVLITCGGAYDADSGYADNLVIIAEPVT